MPERIWTGALAKVNREDRCRGCGRDRSELYRMSRTLEAAHLLGRAFDLKLPNGKRFVHERSVVPLCGPATTTDTCHARFDGHTLDLWPLLHDEERQWCEGRVGYGQARRRISGRGWRP